MGPWLITAGRVYNGVAERALEQAYVAYTQHSCKNYR